MVDKCRCCDSKLTSLPILKYSNMPKNAQNFLTEKELEKEVGAELKLYQCNYCGLIQILEEPVPYFRDVIRSAEVSEEMHHFRVEQFETFMQRYQLAGKRIVEIGSGSGEYMEIFREIGADVYGMEHRQESVENAKQKGLNVFEGYLESERENVCGAPYDAFYCLNFLEHIPTPNVFLRGIYNCLRQDAVGIIEIPNVNMLLEKNLFSEFISDHLMYFTKETARVLLEKNGFEILECNEIWYNYIISIVVRKRKQTDMTAIYEKKNKIAEEVCNFIEQKREQNKKVAAWGAGHQGLTVLSLLNMSGKIECVIDSAVFKQQKYTPATHIPVVSPKILDRGEIGAVLILAAGYSDEVARIMKRDYPNIDVAVLRDYGVEHIS